MEKIISGRYNLRLPLLVGWSQFCAFCPVRLQDTLIINIYERNQVMPLSEHCYFIFLDILSFFISSVLPSFTKLGGINLVLLYSKNLWTLDPSCDFNCSVKLYFLLNRICSYWIFKLRK